MTTTVKYILGAFGAAVIAGSVFFYVHTKNATQSEQNTNIALTDTGSTTPDTSKKIPFSEFVKRGGTLECTVKQYVSNMKTEGTVYLDNGMLHGQFTANYGGQKANVDFLMRDGFTYVWNSILPKQGFKIKNDTTVTTTGTKATNEVHVTAESYFNQIGDYSCKDWAADASKFTIPTTITFTAVK